MKFFSSFYQKKNILIGMAVGFLCLLLLLLTMITYWHQARSITSILIAQEIPELEAVFKKIDDTCGIVDFDHQKNYIDFLNVISFTGSEVGAMNLAYPDKWQGPYKKENPTVQEENYLIVRTKKGYFIVPGEGVMLSNGKVMGKDISLNEHADIEAMMKDEAKLNYKGTPLAAKIKLSGRQLPVNPFVDDTFDVGLNNQKPESKAA
jgi:hypothetical protein